MDELDNLIMSTISALGGTATLSQVIALLEATYPVRFTRARVRNHTNSLVRYKFLDRWIDPADPCNGSQCPPYHYTIRDE